MTAVETGAGVALAPATDQRRYVYAVIVKVPDVAAGESGNLATAAGDVWLDAQAVGGASMDPPVRISDALGQPTMLELFIQAPVFYLGEIVILDDEYGREVIGKQRKPSKWSVDVEHFDDVREAIERSLEVTT